MSAPVALGGRAPDRPNKANRDVKVTTKDGVELAVSDTGHVPGGHTLVFLHGFCLNRTSWAAHAERTIRRYGQRVRVISYDHRGHGCSATAPADTYHIDQLAADLADVLTALHVTEPLTLIGHSMGAMTTLAYLSRARAARPVDPQGLVLVGAAAGRLTEHGVGRLLDTPATAALSSLAAHAPDVALRALVGPLCAALRRWHGNARTTTLSAALLSALTTTPIATALGFLPSLRAYDESATLGSVRARTVIVSGGADLLTPPAHAFELAAGIPGAQHLHIPNAGHMLPQQAPAVLTAAIAHASALDALAPCRTTLEAVGSRFPNGDPQ